MLSEYPLTTSAPTTDIARSRKFYGEEMGLKEIFSDDTGILFEAGKGTTLYLYKRAASKADHTIATFQVKNIEKEMEILRARNVWFEEYDLPDMKTVNGVATWGEDKAAWIKDPDGNIIGLFEKG